MAQNHTGAAAKIAAVGSLLVALFGLAVCLAVGFAFYYVFIS